MAETVINVNPSVLIVHPRNAEFFDDVDGAEFDRLVESIKDHGVLTPLRVTKDMTIISGHQRRRAALKAGCNSVPVIVDESDDDNDVLMKLIETNFGRIKNDKVKQARWLDEYMRLKGVRQGSAGKRSIEGNNSPLKQEDIAKELGVDVSTLKNLKSLLKLDPALQALISDGKINATTGFKILAKLSPEEQAKLVDKLPDNVKFSAKSINDHIEEMRQDLVAHTNSVKQENDKLMGENDRLIRENNELRTGSTLPVNEATQKKIDQLEADKRKYYEDADRLKKETERLRGEIDKALKAKALAEAKANGGDDAVIALENEIDTLKQKLEAEERKSNDLAFQLEEKDDQINNLKRESKDGYLRKALRLNETPEELTQRERDELAFNIQTAIGQFQSKVEGALTQTDSFPCVGKAMLKTLVETLSEALSVGNRLKAALIVASGYNDDPDYDDDDYELDDSGLDFNLGA